MLLYTYTLICKVLFHIMVYVSHMFTRIKKSNKSNKIAVLMIVLARFSLRVKYDGKILCASPLLVYKAFQHVF